ncbi:MAG TPA: ABC transporter ATP-binding protein [Candidatus Poseidoniaceae archaeon]|nr:ABC transporter ATP-binding protein [Candidatus Thermoplasmatota archaeon]DAC52091.1 MAG TPA: ABC transporter ATP-binding protein [Candidatus Poseidoniales archaeon]DAC59742.1 MAG TPA: ABC transporter ATP-binding protein [Candidatus Poseidoniales archaeon]HII23791.1 ABC transporter ATP-binding protein [Candidatus Poseidoniaceae archaeon]HII50397.1 ABC transporter ATP-binding protein [Candidatus Poseidoniaceae archaeon]|tara:strand:+ start:5750 stop:6448 length:699 start_codon:yes stop_codon:yes gene_type:complete
MRAVMQANELWKLYASGESTVQAVKGVNVTIGEGEMIAIMGPSGCGKTTLLNVLSGIDEPTAGEVTIDEKSLFAVSDNERSRMRAEYLGFIFQDFNLLPVLSAVENVELPLLLLGKPANEARNTALDALKAVGLGERSGHRPSELSGGQQQRVAIARAIVHNPSVVLCDEPTGNLDSATSASVMELLKSINKKMGTTFLLVTHDSEVAKQCNRILHMDDGEIISDQRGDEEE